MTKRGFWNTVAAGAFRKEFSFSGGGTYGYAGPWGWLFNLLPGTQYDYRREAGNLWENSIVLACLKWQSRCFPEAPPVVERRGEDGKWVAVADHPFVPLIENPNPFWTDCEMWAATLLSLAVDGNAYWFKRRSRAGRVVELYYVPHWMIEPRWPDDGSVFLDRYEYFVNGCPMTLPVEDVVHFRDGVDPRNYRKGLSPLGAVLREVCTDNESATFSAALLRNMGVPGVVISPAREEGELAAEERDKLMKLWQQKFAGDRRGEPLVTQIPIKVDAPSFSPEQMVIDKVRQVPEERITAALGIPAIVVGFGAGLSRSTYSNFKEAREAAYESNIIPTKRILGKQLTQQLLAEFEDVRRYRIGWDFSEVRAVQESQNVLLAALTQAVGGAWLAPNEARAYLGRPAIEGGDTLRQGSGALEPQRSGAHRGSAEKGASAGTGEQENRGTGEATEWGPERDQKAGSRAAPAEIASTETLSCKEDGDANAPCHLFSCSPVRPLECPGRVLLVRHGRTAMNGAGEGSPDRIRGWIDVPLSADGEAEAEQVARQLAGQGITRLLSSDLLRARQTAEAIQRATGVACVEPSPAFRPWNLGELQGRATAEVLPAIRDYVVNRPDERVPGGESFHEFRRRLLGALQTAMAEASAANTVMAIVTHYRCVKLCQAWLAAGGEEDTLDLAVFFADDAPTGSVVEIGGAKNRRTGEQANRRPIRPVRPIGPINLNT